MGEEKEKVEGEGEKAATEEGETEGAEKAEGETEGGNKSEDKLKEAKAKVKEALDNIHMPKIPKIHKPAFLKKKKEGEAGQLLSEDWEEEEEGASKSCPRATIS